MSPVAICLIIFCVLLVVGVIGTYIYKKMKGLPTGDCGCCSHTKKGNKMLKAYKKKYPDTKPSEHSCSCGHCQDIDKKE